MKSVGVAGGIGSGKSTLCSFWENKEGVTVIYADDYAKELMAIDSEVKKRIADTFGPASYHPDGSLNKDHLIREAFEHNRVDELNSIVHPVLRERLKEIASEEKKKGTKLFVVEAAILLNEGRPDFPEIIVLVTGDKEARLKRVKERDQSSDKEILERMKKQPNFDDMHHLADFVITNNGTVDELKKKSEKLFIKLIGD